MSEATPYMHKYIFENGRALARTLAQSQDGIDEVARKAAERGCKRIVLSGFGSSYTAAWAAKPAFDRFVEIPTFVLPANELGYYPELVDEDALVAILSRSGERKWIIEGMRVAEQQKAFTVAITGAANSLMAQRAARTALTAEGPEISFPKTKSVTSGIGLFLSLALAISTRPEAQSMRERLDDIPTVIDTTLAEVAERTEQLARQFGEHDRVIVGGTGGNTGIAMEFALTLQEAALVTTEWCDTGNLFHGPLCALDHRWLVVLMVTADDSEISSDTLDLVRSLGGKTLGVISSNSLLTVDPDDSLFVPEASDRIFSPLINLPVLQLLTYHWAVSRGVNPDAPPGSDRIIRALVPAGREEPEARMIAATSPPASAP